MNDILGFWLVCWLGVYTMTRGLCGGVIGLLFAESMRNFRAIIISSMCQFFNPFLKVLKEAKKTRHRRVKTPLDAIMGGCMVF